MSSAPTAPSSASPRHRALPYIVLSVLGPISLMIILWPFIWWLAHVLEAGQTPAPWHSDFGMFWASGHFAVGAVPGQTYTRHLLFAWESQHVVGFRGKDPFVYPPPTLLLTRLIDVSGYWRAYLGWAVGLTGLSIAVLRIARLPWVMIAFTLLTPAALYDIMIGQFSALSSCCFVASLLLVDAAPARSGFFSALTLLKPQMALLAPIAILARRRWSAIIVGIIVVSLLCLLTTLAFGLDLWRGYFSHGLASSHNLLTLPYPRPNFPPHYRGGFEYGEISIFYSLRSFGLSFAMAMAGQMLAAILASVACWSLWRRDDVDPITRVAMTVFLGLLVTPYGFPQDMVAYSLGIILLVQRRGVLEVGDVLLLLWPALLIFSSEMLDRSITPLVILWALARAYRMLRQSRPIPIVLTAGQAE
ncbi:MAG: glycosyltransferase family 87 protein [Acidocella sp.]|nr:glycosyltransferase family 87 protein [Acidocella sp.]